MRTGIFYTLALVVAIAMFSIASAGEADGTGKKRAGPAGGQGMAGVLLQHAEELGLSADQKAKLEEMAKGPMGILTEEQRKKALEIVKASRPNAGPEADAKRAKKKDAPEGEKKSEDKKPDEKKPEDK